MLGSLWLCTLLNLPDAVASVPWYGDFVLAVSLFLASFTLLGLYRGVPVYRGAPLGYAEEIRRLTWGTTLGCGVLAALVLGQSALGVPASLALPLMMGGATLVLVPTARTVMRLLFGRWKRWGDPVVIFGAGRTGQVVISTLQRNPELGLRPVAVFDDHARGEVLGVPVVGTLEQAHRLAAACRVPYAIWAIPGLQSEDVTQRLRQAGRSFRRWLVITSRDFDQSMRWHSARDIRKGRVFPARTRPRPQQVRRATGRVKRLLDLALTLAGGAVAFPLMAVLALLIRLDSPGPVLFTQRRPGRGGRFFTIYKFRTMHVRPVTLSPQQQEEFEKYGKIRNDPRVTRVGQWLRRTSLDELPQLFNVLKGDMSLVGPRAYLEEQIGDLGDDRELIFQATPGVTGLWQISGRSETTLEQRLALDALYVRSWSIWLDLSILLQTSFAILGGKGAY